MKLPISTLTLLTLLALPSCLHAHEADDIIIFTKNITTYSNADFDKPCGTIAAGRACAEIESEDDAKTYVFHHPDYSESLVIMDEYVVYFEPSQDWVRPTYIPLEAFESSTEKAAAVELRQIGWPGKVIFECVMKNRESIEVEVVQLKDPAVRMMEISNYEPFEFNFVPMRGKLLLKVGSSFFYNSEPIGNCLFNASGEYIENIQFALWVDNDGFCHSVDQLGNDHRIRTLGTISGEIPENEFFCILSDNAVILDDCVYLAPGARR